MDRIDDPKIIIGNGFNEAEAELESARKKMQTRERYIKVFDRTVLEAVENVYRADASVMGPKANNSFLLDNLLFASPESIKTQNDARANERGNHLEHENRSYCRSRTYKR
jgi:hypothetical protein